MSWARRWLALVYIATLTEYGVASFTAYSEYKLENGKYVHMGRGKNVVYKATFEIPDSRK